MTLAAALLSLAVVPATPAAANEDFGVPGSRARPIPIVLEADQFQGACDVPDLTVGTTCGFWFNDDNATTGDLNFGFANLDQWGVSADAACESASGSALLQYIVNDYPDPLTLGKSGLRYVCSTNGITSSIWDGLADRVGSTLITAVNDCNQQVDASGGIVTCGSAAPDKFAVVGFTAMRLVAIYKGNDPAAIGSPGTPGACGIRSADPNSACLVMEWQGPLRSLRIVTSGTGDGSVRRDPKGYVCKPNCTASYVNRSKVRLTAYPDPGSAFAGWSGACSDLMPCVVRMDRARRVTATFRS